MRSETKWLYQNVVNVMTVRFEIEFYLPYLLDMKNNISRIWIFPFYSKITEMHAGKTSVATFI